MARFAEILLPSVCHRLETNVSKFNGLPAIARPPRVAISFFSFDRHHLSRLTLARVLRFKPAVWSLRVWQDGARTRHSGRVVGHAGRIRRNLEMFEALGLDVEHEPDPNNGTALNFWAAERWAFETMQADIGIFSKMTS